MEPEVITAYACDASASRRPCGAEARWAIQPRISAMLRRMAWQVLASVEALHPSDSCDQILIGQLAFDVSENGVHAIGRRKLSPRHAPRHFIDVILQMLRRHPMMDSENLALQLCPYTFNRLRVNDPAPLAFLGVIDRLMLRIIHGIGKYAVRICDEHIRIGRHNVVDKFLRFRGADALRNNAGNHAALALHRAKDANVSILPRSLWTFAAFHKSRVYFDDARKRLVEGLDAGGVAQAVQHEPRGLLRDVQVLGECGAGDALGVIGDEPDGGKPRLQRQFGILENGADADRKIDVALGTFEQGLFGKLVNLVMTAMGAVCSFLPANRLQMLDARLLVREGSEQVNEAFKMSHRRLPESWVHNAPRIGWCQAVWHLYLSLTCRARLSSPDNALAGA